jgi:hypothetical protein
VGEPNTAVIHFRDEAEEIVHIEALPDHPDPTGFVVGEGKQQRKLTWAEVTSVVIFGPNGHPMSWGPQSR